MQLPNDKRLLNFIRYIPVAIIGLFALAVNFVLIQQNRTEAAQNVDMLRTNLINHQQNIINQQVQQTYNQIQAEKHNIVQKLKDQAKLRVYEAHDIATRLFDTHPNKSKQEVTKMISEALRAIRYNDGRSYFFIFQMDGVNVMHGLKPETEGLSGWDNQDTHGTFILKEHIKLIQAQGGEAFYHWWFNKPDQPKNVEFEKIGFGKYFAPYDWFIGTGEYVADIKNDVKQAMLKKLNSYEYGDNGYIFVVDENKNFIAHIDPLLVGQPANQSVNFALDNLFSSNAVQSGFITYSLIPDSSSKNVEKRRSFVKVVKDWNWIIGMGFDVDKFEAELASSVLVLEQSNRIELVKILLLSAISTSLVVGLSLFAGNLVGHRFTRFQNKIERDFSELEHTKDTMQYKALHDVLTGLPNRTKLLDVIKQGLEFAKLNERLLAVMFVDLDDFKKVNDQYGHSCGDILLMQISLRFESILSDIDSVSRFGGDEFIFCFPDLSNKQHAEEKIRFIQHVFRKPFLIEGKSIIINCSVGVSMYPIDSASPESLIRKADIVLYKSKSLCKGGSMFYDTQINEEVQLDYTIEEELRIALDRNEISVFYQPQMDVITGDMTGVEALARWSNQRLGSISPAKFIMVAENIGIIHDIGLFIFRRACEDTLSVSANGDNALNVSINVSPKQFMVCDFTEQLIEIADAVGIDITRITLEITESVALDDIGKVLPILNDLRVLGFGVSLDDFGTGYSSLSYLNNLPITEIKIDRSFIEQLSCNSQSHSLIKAIVAIGNACNMKVVAEGVETEEQYNQLIRYKCNVIQGYYFSRPLPICDIRQKINKSIVSQFDVA